MEADKELKSIIDSGRIPNAFLFEGPAGSGKLKSAIEFTQSLFMLNSSNNSLENYHPITLWAHKIKTRDQNNIIYHQNRGDIEANT